MNKLMELRQRAAALAVDAETLVNQAEEEDRDFDDGENTAYDETLTELRQLNARIGRLEQMETTKSTRTAPNVNLKTRPGETEERAVAYFFRTGDVGAVSHLATQEGRNIGIDLKLMTARQQKRAEERAAVDSTINVTTDADGGYSVPTGFSGMIARRKNEVMLAEKLGLVRLMGKGTTVNAPFENADPQAFAATSEQADDGSTNNYERDAVVLGNKAFTLAKKTKKLQLTEEVLEDEDAELLDYIANWIGRSIATTHNSLMLTEVASAGTSFKTFASASAIAAGEPEDIVFNDTLGYYLDDASSPAWVMRPTTFGTIASITGDARLYAETPGGSFMRTLLGYPAHFSNNAAAIAASAKSAYFGDWQTVGYREGDGLRIIVDPYTIDGIVQYKYSFRAVYGVLIAGGIGYGVHPSA